MRSGIFGSLDGSEFVSFVFLWKLARSCSEFTDRYGTRWSFSLLPIGGYLKLDQTDLFNCAAQNSNVPSRRAAVYAAGSVENSFFFLLFIRFHGRSLGPHDLFRR